jgi:hypothetical protein
VLTITTTTTTIIMELLINNISDTDFNFYFWIDVF